MYVQQLQSFQGKDNFLWWFIMNYTEIVKGFTHLLKKGVSLIYHDQDQFSFDDFKKYLVLVALLSHLDYNKICFLYLVTSKSTIGMVLIQEDKSQ
jgi:hypothetical protein